MSENPDGQAAQPQEGSIDEGGGAGYDTKALCELQWVMVRLSGTSFLEELCSANKDGGIGRARYGRAMESMVAESLRSTRSQKALGICSLLSFLN